MNLASDARLLGLRKRNFIRAVGLHHRVGEGKENERKDQINKFGFSNSIFLLYVLSIFPFPLETANKALRRLQRMRNVGRPASDWLMLWGSEQKTIKLYIGSKWTQSFNSF